MANRKAAITQADLARILRAHRDAGIPVSRTVVSRDGEVTVYVTDHPAKGGPNDWDAAQ